MMAFFRPLLRKIQSLLLGLIRILRKAICCRRRRQDPEMILPLVVKYNSVHVSNFGKEVSKDWSSWDQKSHTPTSLKSEAAVINMDHQKSSVDGEEPPTTGNEDFFKDMVPQFRKPKKLVVKLPEEENQKSTNNEHSSRLSMDPDTISGPELGLLEDNPSNWELGESSDELWDSDSLIREKKLAEREKRIAEHQRRKLEKEAHRMSKKAAPFNKDSPLHVTEIKDKTKYS